MTMIYVSNKLTKDLQRCSESQVKEILAVILHKALINVTDTRKEATVRASDLMDECFSTKPIYLNEYYSDKSIGSGQYESLCKNIVGAELSWALNSDPDGSEGVTIVINTLKSTISVSSKYGDNGTALCVEAYYAFDGRGYKEASIALVSDPKFLQAHIENEHPFGICSTKIAA